MKHGINQFSVLS